MSRTLIIAAHPDDEVLGCGGTIARLVREGHEVFTAILGEGVTSRSLGPEADARGIESLRLQSKEVAVCLGVSKIFNFDLPDNRFDALPLLDIVKIVEDLIERLAPSIIYTHHSGDLNIDHVLTNRAVLTATRPMKDGVVKEIFAFEVPSATHWFFGQTRSNGFQPNVFMDIAQTLELKIKAMQIYESEIRSFPHPRAPEAIRSLARFRGSQSGLDAAESFELVRCIKSTV